MFFRNLLNLLKNFRVLCVHVKSFTGIVVQIEEQRRVVFLSFSGIGSVGSLGEIVSLPRSVANRHQSGPAIIEHRFARAGSFAKEDR